MKDQKCAVFEIGKKASAQTIRNAVGMKLQRPIGNQPCKKLETAIQAIEKKATSGMI